MSDSSRTQLLRSVETVFAEVPSTPAMTLQRFTKSALAHKNATVVSADIRSDRMRSDLGLTGVDVAGSIEHELSMGSFDDLIEAALCGTWTTAGDVTFANGVGNNTTTFTSATAAFVSTDIGKSFIGPTIPYGTYIVSITNGTTVVLSNVVPTGTSLSFTIKARTGAGNVLVNGTTNRSFLVEEGFLDVSQFISYRGMAVNTMELNISSRAIIGLNFGFMGAQGFIAGTTVAGSVVGPSTTPLVTAGPAVSGIEANTNWTGLKIKNLKLTVNNNMRVRDSVEQVASDDFGRGAMDVTFTADVYFKTGTLYSQFLANTFTGFQFTVTDQTYPLRSLTFVLPKVKLPDANPDVSGVDSDVMMSIEGRALYDPVTGNQIKILRT